MISEIFMRFPGGRDRALTLSYDDGVEQDIKLIEILNKYGIKATFNINSGLYTPKGTVFPEGRIHRRMTHEASVELYKNSPHEVAVHSFSHPFLDKIPPASVIDEIIKDRKNTFQSLIFRLKNIEHNTLTLFVTSAKRHKHPYSLFTFMQKVLRNKI